MLFADTPYWIALANPRDDWNARARTATESLADARIVTTQQVLLEFLSFFSSFGPPFRHAAVRMVHAILDAPNIEIIPHTPDAFAAALELFRQQPADQGRSLADCINTAAMQDHDLAGVLTCDRAYAGVGMVVLLR